VATRKLGKYQLFERLGRGGMAEVYRAHHISLDRYVAIKVLHAFLADDPEFKERFEKEARNIARLKHPNIVQVYDFENDTENESYYMVMELVEGPTLKDVLTRLAERGEVMPLAEAIRIIREAASALAYAHSQKMIHRDVKPANLMLDRDNRVVLTDFGIAKIVTGAQFTASGGMVGTPAYMAPEQGLGEAGDERSDLYSLGVMLFQLVTGQLPYDADTPLAIILKHLNEPIPTSRSINPKVPEPIDQIIRRLMAKDPVNRYQTANELIADLDRFAHGLPLADSSSPRAEHETLDLRPFSVRTTKEIKPIASDQPPRRRIPLLLWIIFGGVIGVGIFAAVQSSGLPLLAFFTTPTPTPTITSTFTSTQPNMVTTAPTFTLMPIIPPSNTATDIPINTPTATATNTPTPAQIPTDTPTVTFTFTNTPTWTATNTATDSPTPSATLRPTNTPTPSITLTPTLDITLTLIQATLLSDFQTATINACDFNYTIVQQDPPDAGYVATNKDYERKITLRNTGSCPWERNSALMFVSGENFNAGARIIIRDRVDVGEDVTLIFKGRTPNAGGLLSGQWELRTPGNIRIGQPLFISINVFEG
jgi:serine/threonine protein kinase